MDSQVALVTGCSTGIGRATATELARAGYEVVATARCPEELEGIGSAMALRLDVVDDASIETAVKAVLERYGRIDVLVNNAGYAIRGAIEELDIDAVERMFDVNVNGVIRLADAVVPSMRARGSGRIVNIASIGGKLASPANGSYTATKHAVEALSDAMRWELGPIRHQGHLDWAGRDQIQLRGDRAARLELVDCATGLAIWPALRSPHHRMDHEHRGSRIPTAIGSSWCNGHRATRTASQRLTFARAAPAARLRGLDGLGLGRPNASDHGPAAAGYSERRSRR